MPRIAASVGIFALIAFAIGFNVTRYPRVWEMVGRSPSLAQAGQSSQAEATSESASALSSDGSATSGWSSRAESDSSGTDSSYSRYGSDPYSDYGSSKDDSTGVWGEKSTTTSSSYTNPYESSYSSGDSSGSYGSNGYDSSNYDSNSYDSGKNDSGTYGSSNYGSNSYDSDNNDSGAYGSSNYQSGSDGSGGYGTGGYANDGYGSSGRGSDGNGSNTADSDQYKASDNSYQYDSGDSRGYGVDEPAKATSSPSYAYNAGGTDEPVRPSSGRPMVPLVQSGGLSGGGTTMANSTIRRLPPVGWGTGQGARERFRQDPPPLYPTTGLN